MVTLYGEPVEQDVTGVRRSRDRQFRHAGPKRSPSQDDAACRLADRAVFDGLLFRFLPRPCKCGLRRSLDGQGSSPFAGSVWFWEWSFLRLVLFV